MGPSKIVKLPCCGGQEAILDELVSQLETVMLQMMLQLVNDEDSDYQSICTNILENIFVRCQQSVTRTGRIISFRLNYIKL